MSSTTLSPRVLKNKGVPVEVNVLDRDPSSGLWVRSGETDVVHLQFTNAVLAELEDPDLGWQPRVLSEEDRAATLAAIADGKAPPPPKGALAYWQEDLQARPYRALGRTLALLWGWYTVRDGVELPDYRRAGLAMVDGRIDVYGQGVSAAFMLANGVDPERVGEVLAATEKSAAARRRVMDATIDRQLTEQQAAEAKQLEAQEAALASEDEEPPTPTSQSDLADELAAKKPAASRTVARSTGTRGSRGSSRGREQDGSGESSGT